MYLRIGEILGSLFYSIQKLFFFFLILCPQVQAESYTVFEHIVLSQDISVSGHHLCQDGRYLYFKSTEDCKRAGVAFDCQRGLKIAPLSSVERILSEPGGVGVTRFYAVKQSFRSRTYLTEEGDDGGSLLKQEESKIPYCEGREILEPANVGSWRYSDPLEEKVLIEKLYYSGFVLINTPYGSLNSIKNLRNEQNDNSDPMKQDLSFKSPVCNSFLSDGALRLLSGEYSGNGVSQFRVRTLQVLSTDLFIQTENQDSNSVGFSCQPFVKEI